MPRTVNATLTLSNIESDVVLLTFDTPDKGANVLSASVLDELAGHLNELEGRDDLAGLVIASGKPNMFIAGADLREFVASLDISKEQVIQMCCRGQTLFGRLSKCPFVTVAAIDGICVGGGAELAIWCDRRIMSDGPKTEFGFPEVKLGLYPGWGGTARASRIVGLSNAIELVTGGESIDAAASLAMGLASHVAAQDRLIEAAVDLVRAEQVTGQYLADRQQWSQPIDMEETELGFLGATASAVIQQQTKGQYPAPEAALEVMLEAAGRDVDAACRMEAEGMAELFGSPVNAALLNIFFLADRNKKDAGIDGKESTPAMIESVGIIGSGIMGAGIAAANVKRNVPVSMMDVSAEAIRRGVQAVLEEVAYNKKIKGPDVQRAVEFAPLINGTLSDAEVASCDLVIEAAVENADVKDQIFQRLEPQLDSDAFLASNTSTIPITRLAEKLQRPERFCGIHFFNPVRRMKLVEIIRGEKTSDLTVATAVAYAKRLGKSPIVVNDGPGFLINRLLFPYMQEALELVAEGAEIKDVERAAKVFGMPMGPIELYDMVGIDTALFAGGTMQQAFPDRMCESPILPALVEAERLGKKNGIGFYSYRNKRGRRQPDPELPALLQPFIRGQERFTPDQITARLFMPMLLEATRVIQDGIVRDPRDVDLGLIFGIGFPPFKGGLLFWADTIGAESILQMITPLEKIGSRFEPTELLREMAQSGKKFYAEREHASP